MAVRSGLLYGPADAVTSVGALFTVPTGFTAVVRSIRLVNHSGTASNIFVAITPAGGSSAEIYEEISMPAHTTRVLGDWMALNEGDRLEATCNAASRITVSVFGALLDGANPDLPL